MNILLWPVLLLRTFSLGVCDRLRLYYGTELTILTLSTAVLGPRGRAEQVQHCAVPLV